MCFQYLQSSYCHFISTLLLFLLKKKDNVSTKRCMKEYKVKVAKQQMHVTETRTLESLHSSPCTFCVTELHKAQSISLVTTLQEESGSRKKVSSKLARKKEISPVIRGVSSLQM